MEYTNEEILHATVTAATAQIYNDLKQCMQNGEPLGHYINLNNNDYNQGPMGIHHLNPIKSALHVPQPAFIGQPASMQPVGMNYTSVSGTPGMVIDDSSDDEPLSSAPASSAESCSSSRYSPEPTDDEKSSSSATSTTKRSTPASNMFKALHAAKLTTKAEPVPKPESSEASRLKRRYSQMSGRTPSGKRLMGESDPENREIMRLRQEENLEFDEIARIMNRKRVAAHLPASFTANAIYSRYKRNGPLIAAADGKEFVPAPRDKKTNGKGINFKKAFVLEPFDAEEDELLVRAVKEIEDEKWALIAKRLHELGGSVHAPEMCSSRYACL